MDDIIRKVAQYLDDGVEIVWIIDLKEHIVIVYQAGSRHPKVLTVSDTLDGGDVIPGFSIPVAALFE